jgi:hypothetical protein
LVLPEFTEREKNVIYAGVNIREFMAVSLTSMFQEENENRI